MAFAHLGNLRRGMAVARSDLSQVLARHAIQPIDSFAVIPRRNQQLVKWSPVIAPIQIKSDALTQFFIVDFTAPPLIEHMLIAGKDGFHSDHDWSVSNHRAVSSSDAA